MTEPTNLADYALGHLTPEESAALEAKLAADPQAAFTARELSQLAEALRAAHDTPALPEPSAGLRAALEAELSAGASVDSVTNVPPVGTQLPNTLQPGALSINGSAPSHHDANHLAVPLAVIANQSPQQSHLSFFASLAALVIVCVAIGFYFGNASGVHHAASAPASRRVVAANPTRNSSPTLLKREASSLHQSSELKDIRAAAHLLGDPTIKPSLLSNSIDFPVYAETVFGNGFYEGHHYQNQLQLAVTEPTESELLAPANHPTVGMVLFGGQLIEELQASSSRAAQSDSQKVSTPIAWRFDSGSLESRHELSTNHLNDTTGNYSNISTNAALNGNTSANIATNGNNVQLLFGNGSYNNSLAFDNISTGSISNGNISDIATANVNIASNNQSSSTLVLSGANTYNSWADVSGGTLLLSNVAAAPALVKAGVGTLILDSANTYVGKTIVDAGGLTLGVNQGSHQATMFGTLADSGGVTVHNGSLSTYANAAPTVSQQLNVARGTTPLNGNNAYTGGTTISGGNLVFNGGSISNSGLALNSGTLTLGDNYASTAPALQFGGKVDSKEKGLSVPHTQSSFDLAKRGTSESLEAKAIQDVYAVPNNPLPALKPATAPSPTGRGYAPVGATIAPAQQAAVPAGSAGVDQLARGNNPRSYEFRPDNLAIAERAGAAREEESEQRRKSRFLPELVPADAPLLLTREAPEQNAFERLVENEYQRVSDQPLSTFSIDVDTASYTLVRRFLDAGKLPPADAVRVEELVNYFRYDYPQPEAGVPFSVNTEVAECPWNRQARLLRVGLQGRELPKADRPAANLVFLLDVSGSMAAANKLPLVKRSMQMLTQQLNERDRVAIVVYAGNSGLALPATSGDQHETILGTIERLEAGGSTNGAGGIQLAYQVASEQKLDQGINRVVLCTDGDFNVGITDRDDLAKLIEQKAKSGVYLSALGFGMGNYKDATLEQLADKGNGNYAYIDDDREAHKVLVEQMAGTLVTIAKDVKIQIEFNPKQVTSYRLVGYENRLLAKEDFNDDKKDAGDIGAGHSVTALYEIIPADNQSGRPAVDALKYQRQLDTTPAADRAELLTLKLRYKEPDGQTSRLIEHSVADASEPCMKASADFRFAAAVAGFGMLLRESAYRGDLTLDTVTELASSSLGRDDNGHRAAFVAMIQRARTLKR